MNICLDCGATFEDHEIKVYVEMHGHTTGYGEEWGVCPNCCSDNFEEAVRRCTNCVNWEDCPYYDEEEVCDEHRFEEER